MNCCKCGCELEFENENIFSYASVYVYQNINGEKGPLKRIYCKKCAHTNVPLNVNSIDRGRRSPRDGEED